MATVATIRDELRLFTVEYSTDGSDDSAAANALSTQTNQHVNGANRPVISPMAQHATIALTQALDSRLSFNR